MLGFLGRVLSFELVSSSSARGSMESFAASSGQGPKPSVQLSDNHTTGQGRFSAVTARIELYSVLHAVFPPSFREPGSFVKLTAYRLRTPNPNVRILRHFDRWSQGTAGPLCGAERQLPVRGLDQHSSYCPSMIS